MLSEEYCYTLIPPIGFFCDSPVDEWTVNEMMLSSEAKCVLLWKLTGCCSCVVAGTWCRMWNLPLVMQQMLTRNNSVMACIWFGFLCQIYVFLSSSATFFIIFSQILSALVEDELMYKHLNQQEHITLSEPKQHILKQKSLQNATLAFLWVHPSQKHRSIVEKHNYD